MKDNVWKITKIAYQIMDIRECEVQPIRVLKEINNLEYEDATKLLSEWLLECDNENSINTYETGDIFYGVHIGDGGDGEDYYGNFMNDIFDSQQNQIEEDGFSE